MAKGVERRGRGAAGSAADQSAQAWRSAREYAQWLRSGGEQPRLGITGVLLQQGEVAHFESVADYARFYGGSGQYTRDGGFFLGSPAAVLGFVAVTAAVNTSRRNRAIADAQPTWRELQPTPIIATNLRILCAVGSQGWLSFWFNGLSELYPDPTNWSLTMVYPEVEPLRLTGLAVPYLSVHVTRSVMPDSWQDHPGLAPLLA